MGEWIICIKNDLQKICSNLFQQKESSCFRTDIFILGCVGVCFFNSIERVRECYFWRGIGLFDC